MSKPYYTLVSKGKEQGSTWSPQFGDYVKSVVTEEMSDYKYNQSFEPFSEREQFKVITSGDTQAEINAAIAKLNET